MAKLTFVPYVKPDQKIEEFIALGDSYTAGTGCNGIDEIIAADAVRGKRSYPMQMSTDLDNWGFINGGDNTLPRFSFHACTGDTTVELATKQLQQGDYRDDKNLPRNQPFGKPQIAVLTIGGNDAMLSDILQACIFRAWKPKDCQETLSSLQSDIDSGVLRDKINVALYSVAHAGRNAGGLDRRESFQVFVLSYITFFNDEDTQCNDITWATWPWQTEPKLTTALRKQLNILTDNVNSEIRKAAQDLERMGVIFVEGLEDLYSGHRFCEPKYTDQQMIDYETWFWSPKAHAQTISEGPNDPNNPFVASENRTAAQAILDFVFPGQDNNVSATSADSPPWEWDGAEQYLSLDALLTAMMGDGFGDTAWVPFNYMRSFHPKGTAYGAHAMQLFAAIADNRNVVTANNETDTSIAFPACASEGTPFAKAPVDDFINTFCGTKGAWDRAIVPRISYGNDTTAAGKAKSLASIQFFLLPGTSDKLWLDLRVSPEGCTGTYAFTEGSDDMAKINHCKARFDVVLNECQSDTSTAKLGGTLTDQCLMYTVAAYPNSTVVSPLDIDYGTFLCEPTDTSATGGSSSPFVGTCTCWFSSFPLSRDIFFMPSSGNCKDADETDLFND